jgi:hypothetical protein
MVDVPDHLRRVTADELKALGLSKRTKTYVQSDIVQVTKATPRISGRQVIQSKTGISLEKHSEDYAIIVRTISGVTRGDALLIVKYNRMGRDAFRRDSDVKTIARFDRLFARYSREEHIEAIGSEERIFVSTPQDQRADQHGQHQPPP